MSPEQPADTYGAFCRDNPASHAATGSGPLNGLSFAAKDVMDIAGTTTGFGHPEWLASHKPASGNARAIDKLLASGAELVGRTLSDELSYSLSGENVHYGTPVNPRDATRVAGGSSSGSVVAVAANLVDFALGTDCAGSVRLPASYCGIYGMRPTHNAVSTAGVIPFAPSFDSVGWFARDAGTLNRVGRVLLDCAESTTPASRLLVAEDCLQLVDDEIRQALSPAIASVASHFATRRDVTVAERGLDTFMQCFRTIQGGEIWHSLGDWITRRQPAFGPGIDDRVRDASRVTADQMRAARATRDAIVEHLDALIKPGDALCLPTSPRVAPRKDTATSTLEVTYRYQAICLLSIAGLAGLPEISLPLANSNGLPLGLSLVGARGSDHQLLALAERIAAS